MVVPISLLILLATAPPLSLPAHKSLPQVKVGPALIVVPYKPSGIYRLNEKGGWTFTLPPGSAAPTGRFKSIVMSANAVSIGSGDLDFSSGHDRVEMGTTDPGMFNAVITPPEGPPMALGIAFAPTELKPDVPRPDDFDAFWKKKVRELEAVPAKPLLTPAESGDANVDYATIRMDHVNGTHVYGQIAKPKRRGKFPALLILQWASPPYRLWSPWVVDRAREGWLALNIEPHDVLPTEPQSYYDSLPSTLKNYSSVDQDDRDNSYFVEMYLRDYRAVDYLSHRPDWDGKTLVVMGGSMGGQQSMAVAGLHK